MLTVVATVIGIAAGALGLWAWLRTASTSRLRLAEDQRRSLLADAEACVHGIPVNDLHGVVTRVEL